MRPMGPPGKGVPKVLEGAEYRFEPRSSDLKACSWTLPLGQAAQIMLRRYAAEVVQGCPVWGLLDPLDVCWLFLLLPCERACIFCILWLAG